MNFDLDKHTIYLTTHGSRAYGTNLPSSDYDYKGVAIPPSIYFHGFAHKFQQSELLVSKGHPSDKVVFDIRKFFQLASDCNPNIIEILFVKEEHHVVLTSAGKLLLENRDLFISKKAKHTFFGYAQSQLKRIKTHRGWLLNPPQKRPERSDFGLPSDKVNNSVIGAANSLLADGHILDSAVMDRLNKEKQYALAVQHWDAFNEWKASRNPARAEMEAAFGFDGKHGLHLIRLMRMGVEILTGKGVIVNRPDAEELLGIRNGRWTYDQLIEESDRLTVLANEHYQSSDLPSEPPINKLDSLCISLVETALRGE